MAIAVHRAAETWRYILFADRGLDPSQQSVFVLKPLPLFERQRVRDALSRTHVDAEGRRLVSTRTGEVAAELALTNIASVENFPAGEPRPWPAGGTIAERAAYLELLGDEQVREIGNEIYARSAIETAPGSPAGNSWPPEHTSSSGGSSGAATSTTAPPASGTPA